MFLSPSNYFFISSRVARQKIIKLYPESVDKKQQEEEEESWKKLFFTKLNSMIHEQDRLIAHHFSWALNEVFYRNSDSLVWGEGGAEWIVVDAGKSCIETNFLETCFYHLRSLERCQQRVKYLFFMKFSVGKKLHIAERRPRRWRNSNSVKQRINVRLMKHKSSRLFAWCCKFWNFNFVGSWSSFCCIDEVKV